jgi:hypothetical protein
MKESDLNYIKPISTYIYMTKKKSRACNFGKLGYDMQTQMMIFTSLDNDCLKKCLIDNVNDNNELKFVCEEDIEDIDYHICTEICLHH